MTTGLPSSTNKLPYHLLSVTNSGTKELFAVDGLSDYMLSCDMIMDQNGIFYTPSYDYDFASTPGNIIVYGFLQSGDLLEILATTNPNSLSWARELYFFAQQSGANQAFNALFVLPDYSNTTNFNISKNGVLLEPGVDFNFSAGVLTFSAYLSMGDVIGIMPAAKLSTLAAVPSFNFDVPSSGSGQSFSNSLLTNYTTTSDALVTLNGVNLQPDTLNTTADFAIFGSNLTIHPYISSGSFITVLCAAKSN
jgi:hypothetical protein